MSINNKGAGRPAPSRQDSIDRMVSLGYSREFAEAFVPMTTAEARQRGLARMQYQSAYSIINRRPAR